MYLLGSVSVLSVSFKVIYLHILIILLQHKYFYFFNPVGLRHLKLTKKFLFHCLGITNKCISSYQFNISLSCSYMFRHLCSIRRELVCTLWVACQFRFLVDKILCIMWLVVCVLCCGLVRIDLSIYAAEYVPFSRLMCLFLIKVSLSCRCNKFTYIFLRRNCSR
jgi:hypothetical protein